MALFPNYILCIIIKYLFDDEHLPFSYKLSLGTIGKAVLKCLSGRYSGKFKIDTKDKVQLHTSEYCLIKSIKSIKINLKYSNSKNNTAIESFIHIQNIFKDLEILDIHYPQRDFTLSNLTIDYFPNLKKLILQGFKISENDTKQIQRLPPLEELSIISFRDELVPFVILLLNQLKSSIVGLSLELYQEPEESVVLLSNYLKTYKQLNRLYLSFDDGYTQHLMDMIDKNQNQLQYLTFEVFDNDQIYRFMNMLDMMSNLTNLSLEGYLMVDPSLPLFPRLKHVRHLKIQGYHSVMSKMLLSNLGSPCSLETLEIQSLPYSVQKNIEMFIQSNNSLTTLKLKLHITLDLKNLSEYISKHPKLQNLYIHLSIDKNKTHQTKIFSKLHLSSTLQLIHVEISDKKLSKETNFLNTALNYLLSPKPLLHPKPPFTLLSSSKNKSCYVRT
ncbi:hypothetical protein DLAC_00843 [Tieghemostelium lacteum]|uniref:Uncharacterized protein n=1 Tax=Tieghemostelium lacteum TaxID=361077 RepID=A0A152A769_TIELA|nr:hypothetical protein DLAC_00843 [Tieghemostelium lacteum]|eukprot:KYR02046.1 hypothetical protein DLAC_00843 [Tieghemostelium lacteum]